MKLMMTDYQIGWYELILVVVACLMSTSVEAQVQSKIEFVLKDMRSPLIAISQEYYKHPLAPDTTCELALCSVKFRLIRSGWADSIQFSVDTPMAIRIPLADAIKETAQYWRLHQSEPVNVIIPLTIFPSPLCSKEHRRDIGVRTASRMFLYESKTVLNDLELRAIKYLQCAEGQVEGIIYSPIVIAGKITDVYMDSRVRKP